MVVLIDGVKYRHLVPENEAVLERWIEDNYQHIFGAESFYFAKKKIRSRAGIGTIPDAYLIIFDGKPKWCILEVELASHPVYEHVLLQITKFKRAIENASSRKTIVELLYNTIKADIVLEAKLKEKIGSGEIYKFVYDLVAEKPMIVVVIDEKTAPLEEALKDFGGDVRVVEFKTFRREGISEEINAYMFEPIFKDRNQVNNVSLAGETKQVHRRSKKGSIIQAVYSLFDEKSVDNVTYEECEGLAKKIKPNTAFNRNHFAWYKRDYRIKRGSKNSTRNKKAKEAPASYHKDCIRRVSVHLNKEFIKKRKSLYSTADADARLVCLVSKAYITGHKKKIRYWYGFDPSHKNFLLESENAFVAFGCGSAQKIVLMPAKVFIPFLKNMRKTETANHSHWHVKIYEDRSHFYLEQSFGHDAIDMGVYFI